MLRHLPVLACLVVCATASAITPGSLPSAGPIVDGSGDASFLAMLPALQGAYSNIAPSPSPGPSFFSFPGYTIAPGYALDIYFVSHSSDYPNALGLTTTLGDITTGEIVFPSSSFNLGDKVTITGPQTGSVFDITNHTPTGGNLWWDDSTLNSDHTSHIQAALVYSDPTNLWYDVAVDDQAQFGGRDFDWNDLRVAFHFYAVSAPEPATWALLIGFVAIGAWAWRRRQLAA